MSTSLPLQFDRADFVRLVLQDRRPALIGFSAEWCTPCRTMGPVFTNLSQAFGDSIVFGCIDIDNESDLAEQLSVGSVPTMLFFESGLEVKRIFQTPNEAQLETLIEQVLQGNPS